MNINEQYPDRRGKITASQALLYRLKVEQTNSAKWL